MSVNIPQLANLKAAPAAPVNATAVAIYTATSNLRGILNSISICNPSAAGDVFSVSLLSPAAVTYDIYRAKPIAAKETFVLAEHEVPIFDGWSLMVKQGAAAASLHFVAVIGEISSVKGA